jgi:antitoxin ParD1/3/4
MEALMQNVEQLSITISPDVARMIRAKVEEGQYTSSSDVIREALRAWQELEGLRAAQLDMVRRKIAEADADPRPDLEEDDLDRHFACLLESALTRNGRNA